MHLLLAILVSAGIHFRWILDFQIYTYGDWWFKFNESLTDVYSFFVWQSFEHFGRDSVINHFYPIGILSRIFAEYNFAFAVWEKFFFFLPIVVIAPLGTFFLIRNMIGSRWLAFLGTIIYSFNSYFLLRQVDHLQIAVAYAFAPLLLLLYIRVLRGAGILHIVLFSLVYTISCIYEVRVTAIVTVLIGLYTVFVFLTENFQFRKEIFRKLLRVASLVLLLNFFWIITFITVSSLSYESIVDRSLFTNYHHLPNVFTLYYPAWEVFQKPIPFSVNPVPVYTFIIPITVFLGLLLWPLMSGKDKRLWLFWMSVALLGIFLVKQNAHPFPEIYPLLYEHLPGFNIFRESSKFYLIVALSFAVLVPLSIKYLFRARRYIASALVVLVICVMLLNSVSLVTGKVDALFIPRTVPEDYIVFKNFILGSDPGRILWLPEISRYSFFSNKHGRLSARQLVEREWKGFIPLTTGPLEKRLMEVVGQDFSHAYFNVGSIKYVAVPTRDSVSQEAIFYNHGGKNNPIIRQWYIDQLDTIPWLKRVDIGTQELVVYENEGYKPHVFASDQLFAFDSFGNLDPKYDFVSEQLGQEFLFVPLSEGKSTQPLVNLSNPFENIEPQNIVNSSLVNSFESEQAKTTTAYFNQDDARILVNSLPIVATTSPAVLPVNVGTNTIAYENPSYSYENRIVNGSFEDGLWQKEVGDCNKYDDNGLLGMHLSTSEKTEGSQSLQLEATRHIACTSIRVGVTASSTYLLSFDYQSPNSEIAAYYVGFNDPAKTVLSETLPLADTAWHSFSKIIEVPSGATTLSLYLYARATDNETNIINRYDNVQLIQVPDLRDAFYIVSEPEGPPLVEPRVVTFELVNPTKKLVHVEGATTPFFLAMSESYHEQWQLQMNNEKVHGFLNSWWPFAKPDRVRDEYHYKLNGFLNGWYIDTAELCEAKALCTQNPDGSYDIEFVIEFFPQRFFYLGLLISGTTLLFCISYLVYDGVRRIRIRKIS